MSKSRSPVHQISLLKRIVHNLILRPHETGPINAEAFRAHGIFRGKITPTGIAGLLAPGLAAFNDLSEILYTSQPRIERGTEFRRFGEEFMGYLIGQIMGRSPDSITAADLDAINTHFLTWFDSRASDRTVFVACMITPWRSAPVTVGPVTFTHTEDVRTAPFYAAAVTYGDPELDEFIADMKRNESMWLATVTVKDCDTDQAEQLATLGVDLAIVAFQVAQPYLGTANMSRLNNRRGPIMQRTLSTSGGPFSVGGSNRHAGLSIGDGYLTKIASDAAPLLAAVGKRVEAFVNGPFRFKGLEGRWCDAAYWLHQGLAEPMDSIAVAKLETAVEVLFEAESSSGSKARFLQAFDAFFGLAPNDFITPNSEITADRFAKQLVAARSRILHGTLSTLSSRVGADRQSLEYLATTLVRAVASELDLYIGDKGAKDDVDTLLKWIRKRRTPPATDKAP